MKQHTKRWHRMSAILLIIWFSFPNTISWAIEPPMLSDLNVTPPTLRANTGTQSVDIRVQVFDPDGDLDPEKVKVIAKFDDGSKQKNTLATDGNVIFSGQLQIDTARPQQIAIKVKAKDLAKNRATPLKFTLEILGDGTLLLFLATSQDTSEFNDVIDQEIERSQQSLIRYSVATGAALVIETNTSPEFAPSILHPMVVDDRLFTIDRATEANSVNINQRDPATNAIIATGFFSGNTSENCLTIVGNDLYYWDFKESGPFPRSGSFGLKRIETFINPSQATSNEKEFLVSFDEDAIGCGRVTQASGGSLYSAWQPFDENTIGFFRRDLSTGMITEDLGTFDILDAAEFQEIYTFAFDDDRAYYARTRESGGTFEIWRYDFIDLPRLIFASDANDVSAGFISVLRASQGQVAALLHTAPRTNRVLLLNDDAGTFNVLEFETDFYDMELLILP